MRLLLFHRGQSAEPGRLKIEDNHLRSTVIGNGQGEIQIACESRLRANGDGQSTDQSPRLGSAVKYYRQASQKLCQKRHGFRSRTQTGPDVSPGMGSSARHSHAPSRASISRTPAPGWRRTMFWRISAIPVSISTAVVAALSLYLASESML